jgi:hypothetical protein
MTLINLTPAKGLESELLCVVAFHGFQPFCLSLFPFQNVPILIRYDELDSPVTLPTFGSLLCLIRFQRPDF